MGQVNVGFWIVFALPAVIFAVVGCSPSALGRPGERIDWTRCGKLECGSIQVPADYRDPEAGSIRIAVNVHRATSPDKRIGYLLVNPGGPGGSGVQFVFVKSARFSDAIIEHFDIVGFDPRGVGVSDKLVAAFDESGRDFQAMVEGGSEPEFACGELGEQLALLASIDMPIDTPEEIAIGEAAANLCIQSMGPVGGLVHSEYVANDMDEIRKALGAEKIFYLGLSYGSELGVWYATLFPDSVRAMAVDGARNRFPSGPDQPERAPESEELTRADFEETQLAVVETRLAAALAACADPQCPIYNDGDPAGPCLHDGRGAICARDVRMLSDALVLTVGCPGDRPVPGCRPALSGQQKSPHTWAGRRGRSALQPLPRRPGRKQ